MGMYSNLNYADLKIKEGKLEALKKWISRWEEEYFEKGTFIIHEDHLEVEGLDGIKLISYWYDSSLEWIRELNEFVEGTISFEFENCEESAILIFGGEEAKIQISEMADYKIVKADESNPLNKKWDLERI